MSTALLVWRVLWLMVRHRRDPDALVAALRDVQR